MGHRACTITSKRNDPGLRTYNGASHSWPQDLESNQIVTRSMAVQIAEELELLPEALEGLSAHQDQG